MILHPGMKSADFPFRDNDSGGRIPFPANLRGAFGRTIFWQNDSGTFTTRSAEGHGPEDRATAVRRTVLCAVYPQGSEGAEAIFLWVFVLLVAKNPVCTGSRT